MKKKYNLDNQRERIEYFAKVHKYRNSESKKIAIRIYNAVVAAEVGNLNLRDRLVELERDICDEILEEVQND